MVRITCGLCCIGMTICRKHNVPYVFIPLLLNRLIQGLGSLLSPFILRLGVIYEYTDVK